MSFPSSFSQTIKNPSSSISSSNFFPRWDGMQIITMELLEVGTKQGTSASNNKKV